MAPSTVMRRLGFTFLTLAGLVAACSVSTDGLRFIPDSEFGEGLAGKSSGSGGAASIGGKAGIGGVSNKGGTPSAAGASAGDEGGEGGTSSGGSPTGGVAGSNNGGAGTGGMPPTTCMFATGDANDLLIDDFEDGDNVISTTGNRYGDWRASNDMTGGNQTPKPGSEIPRPELNPNGIGYRMRTYGGGFTGWGALLGALFNSTVDRRPCMYSLKAYSGVRFTVGGKGTMRFNIATAKTSSVANGGDCTSGCGHHFGYDFEATDVGAKYSLLFTLLERDGAAEPVMWNPDEALGLEFAVDAGPEFDFWIDDVAFY